MGKAIKLPSSNQFDELQKFKDEYMGTLDIPVTDVPLTAGNLPSILSTNNDVYIKYITKNGVCQINFSLLVKANTSTSTNTDSTGGELALWVTLSNTMPKPLLQSRGQAIPVNSGQVSSANLRVDEDGTFKILINNYFSDTDTWLQNTMTYVLGEQ